jgi:hypothetical protein
MRFRKLRIAWSVGWSVVAVLLVALWVRSYHQEDDLIVPISRPNMLAFASMRGKTFWCPYKVLASDNQTLAQGQWSVGGIGEDTGERNFDVTVHAWPWIPSGGPDAKTLVLPHWFFVIPFFVIAAFPWAIWRFSLRTLLIATTLIALVLGTIVAFR